MPHLIRSLVGKRNRQNRRSGNTVSFDQMRDSMRNDARLPTACAGKEQQRTFHMGNSIALLRV